MSKQTDDLLLVTKEIKAISKILPAVVKISSGYVTFIRGKRVVIDESVYARLADRGLVAVTDDYVTLTSKGLDMCVALGFVKDSLDIKNMSVETIYPEFISKPKGRVGVAGEWYKATDALSSKPDQFDDIADDTVKPWYPKRCDPEENDGYKYENPALWVNIDEATKNYEGLADSYLQLKEQSLKAAKEAHDHLLDACSQDACDCDACRARKALLRFLDSQREEEKNNGTR